MKKRSGFVQEPGSCLFADGLGLVHHGGEHQEGAGYLVDHRVGAGLEGVPVLVTMVFDGIDEADPVAEPSLISKNQRSTAL